MKADIHPDGTLRIQPESITEQVALSKWWDAARVVFPGCPKDVTGIKVGSLAPLAFNREKATP